MNVFVMVVVNKPKPGISVRPTINEFEVFSTLDKASAEATFLYENASLPDEAPDKPEWVLEEPAEDVDHDCIRTWRATYFEVDSELEIREIVVDHDQPEQTGDQSS